MRSRFHNVTGQDTNGIVEPVGEELSELHVSICDLEQEIVSRVAGLTPADQLLHPADGDGCVPESQERPELWIADARHLSSLEMDVPRGSELAKRLPGPGR
jgi:hypothetical protein